MGAVPIRVHSRFELWDVVMHEPRAQRPQEAPLPAAKIGLRGVERFCSGY